MVILSPAASVEPELALASPGAWQAPPRHRRPPPWWESLERPPAVERVRVVRGRLAVRYSVEASPEDIWETSSFLRLLLL